MADRLIRVFPRKTSATPTDELSKVSGPGILDYADQVHISVVFSWDLPKAERLAKLWKRVAPVSIGGPATGQRSEGFVAGRYVAEGQVITSRGCPNRCWFCSVWRREGGIRELLIVDGHHVLDDNLLACSDQHVRKVFDMLRRQNCPVKFTGGLEAARLKDWHIDAFCGLDIHSAFFAYDTPDDLEPLRIAGQKLVEAGLITGSNTTFRCYILAGYPKDTFTQAECRVRQAAQAGFIPYIMLYQGPSGEVRSEGWMDFVRRWSRGNQAMRRGVLLYDRSIGVLREIKHASAE